MRAAGLEGFDGASSGLGPGGGVPLPPHLVFLSSGRKGGELVQNAWAQQQGQRRVTAHVPSPRLTIKLTLTALADFSLMS